MTAPAVTLISASLNSALIMRQMLNSCRRQSRHIPHIIVDGGSTDGTERLVKHYDGVRFVKHHGSSVYQAYNKALECIDSGWVFFIGTDDRFPDVGTFDNVIRHVLMADAEGIQCLHGKIQHLGSNKWIHSNRMESWVIRRDVFQRTGMFGTDDVYFADVAFQKQMASLMVPSSNVDLHLAVVAPGGHTAGRRPSQ